MRVFYSGLAKVGPRRDLRTAEDKKLVRREAPIRAAVIRDSIQVINNGDEAVLRVLRRTQFYYWP